MKQIPDQAIYNYFDQRNLDVSIHDPGEDNEKRVIVANWNDVHNSMTEYLESYFEIDWEDESTTCCECYCHIHTSPGYYGDPGNFIWTGFGAVCKPCVIDNVESYLEEFTFWSDSTMYQYKAIPSWLVEHLEANNFVPFYSINSDCKDAYESGLHAGQTDTPEKVAKLVTSELGPVEMLFCIDSAGQFDVHFSAYIKKEI